MGMIQTRTADSSRRLPLASVWVELHLNILIRSRSRAVFRCVDSWRKPFVHFHLCHASLFLCMLYSVTSLGFPVRIASGQPWRRPVVLLECHTCTEVDFASAENSPGPPRTAGCTALVPHHRWQQWDILLGAPRHPTALLALAPMMMCPRLRSTRLRQHALALSFARSLRL